VQMARTEFVISCLERGYSIVAMEREKAATAGGNMRDCCAIEIMLMQYKKSYVFWNTN